MQRYRALVATDTELEAKWRISCPSWWVDEYPGDESPISVGALLRVPVGFTVDLWRDGEGDDVEWEPIASDGVYRVANAPVVHVWDGSESDVPTWDLMLGPLRVSTDAWMPETFDRAKALEVGDRISGQLTLSLDPSHMGYSPSLRIDAIEVQETPSSGWESVPRVGADHTRRNDNLRIIVVCRLDDTDR